MPINFTMAASDSATSVVMDGVTFNFNKGMQVGTFVTGEPFVVADSDFQITSVSPASADIAADGEIGNGLMKDPFIRSRNVAGQSYATDGPIEQGFDGYLDTGTGGGDGSLTNPGFGATGTPYTAVLNIDPGATGSSVNVPAGTDASYVKSVRSQFADINGSWTTIEKYVVLTVLSAAPPVNSFRPTMAPATKQIYHVADLNLNAFRAITLPAGFETLSQVEATIPKHMGHFGAMGEKLRRFRLDAGLGTVSSNYSAALARIYGKASIILHSAAHTDAEKQNLLYKLVTWGIDLDGYRKSGWLGHGGWAKGAGQHGTFTPIQYLASFALGDGSMLSRAVATNGPFNGARWVTSDMVGQFGGINTVNLPQPFFAENVGVPMDSSTQDTGSQWAARYGTIHRHILAWEGASVALLQNGPSGETGISARNQGSDGFGNDAAAIWALNDRVKEVLPYPSPVWQPGSVWYDLWGVIQTLDGRVPWTGVPDQLHNDNEAGFRGDNGDRITATADGYSWDVTGHDYATETVTRVDFRYSLDGVQYVEALDTTATGSVAGLLRGVNHYVGLRLVSASGVGPWSQNWPLTINGNWADTDRNQFATTGTATAAAPSFTTPPAIHVRRFPNWSVSPGNWIEASASLNDDEVDLICGLGYVSGDAPPAFAFQWKRDGVAISGATSQMYSRTADDAGAVITCEATPSNSAGDGATVETSGVTAPALLVLPAGTLIDTDFRGAFAVNFEPELASFVGTNGTFTHEPTIRIPEVGLNFGAAFVDKTTAFPAGEFNLSRVASANTTYDISGEFAIVGLGREDRTIDFLILNETGTVLFESNILYSEIQADPIDMAIKVFSGSFTVGPTDQTLTVKIESPVNFGGTVGSDLYISKLTIAAAA